MPVITDERLVLPSDKCAQIKEEYMEILPNPHVDLNNARNLQRLRCIFPRGSESFFKANEIKTDYPLPNPDAKRNKAATLDRLAKRKKESLGRVTLRYRLFRVRPLDPDGVAGSTKDITDGLCRCGLLSGDDPTQITLIVEQERVEHYSDERTEVELEWPE